MQYRFAAMSVGTLIVFATLWLMWPSPINAVYWDEPEPPTLTGALAPRPALDNARITQLGTAGTARSFVVTEDGTVFYGTSTGEVRRRHYSSGADAVLANFGNAPVADIDWINETRLGVTTPNGLYAVSTVNGESQRISAGVPGHPFGFAHDLAVAPDGRIYFTDSSTQNHTSERGQNHHLDMLENRPHGALYVWDPRTFRTRLAADRLYFPSGIAVASDNQSVYISERFRFRILRHWIEGPQAGDTEVFASNLPGFPDGLAADGQGRLFIAMPARRSQSLRTIRRNPWLARIVARLPGWLQPPTSRSDTFIAVLDEASGDVIATLDATGQRTCQVSNLNISNSQDLWFGSADCGYMAQLPQAAVQASLHHPSTTAASGND